MSLKSSWCCRSSALICAFCRSSISCISILSLNSRSCLICVSLFSHVFWDLFKFSSQVRKLLESFDSNLEFSLQISFMLFLSSDWNEVVFALIKSSYVFFVSRCQFASSRSFFSVFSCRSLIANWCSQSKARIFAF